MKKPDWIEKIPTEHQEQVMLCAWLRASRIDFFAVPNGARVRMGTAKKLQAEGLTAGAPDIVIVNLSRDWKPIAIEMKRRKGGVVSPEQKKMHEKMRACGWIVIVAHGAEHAIAQIRDCRARYPWVSAQIMRTKLGDVMVSDAVFVGKVPKP